MAAPSTLPCSGRLQLCLRFVVWFLLPFMMPMPPIVTAEANVQCEFTVTCDWHKNQLVLDCLCPADLPGVSQFKDMTLEVDHPSSRFPDNRIVMLDGNGPRRFGVGNLEVITKEFWPKNDRDSKLTVRLNNMETLEYERGYYCKVEMSETPWTLSVPPNVKDCSTTTTSTTTTTTTTTTPSPSTGNTISITPAASVDNDTTRHSTLSLIVPIVVSTCVLITVVVAVVCYVIAKRRRRHRTDLEVKLEMDKDGAGAGDSLIHDPHCRNKDSDDKGCDCNRQDDSFTDESTDTDFDSSARRSGKRGNSHAQAMTTRDETAGDSRRAHRNSEDSEEGRGRPRERQRRCSPSHRRRSGEERERRRSWPRNVTPYHSPTRHASRERLWSRDPAECRAAPGYRVYGDIPRHVTFSEFPFSFVPAFVEGPVSHESAYYPEGTDGYTARGRLFSAPPARFGQQDGYDPQTGVWYQAEDMPPVRGAHYEHGTNAYEGYDGTQLTSGGLPVRQHPHDSAFRGGVAVSPRDMHHARSVPRLVTSPILYQYHDGQAVYGTGPHPSDHFRYHPQYYRGAPATGFSRSAENVLDDYPAASPHAADARREVGLSGLPDQVPAAVSPPISPLEPGQSQVNLLSREGDAPSRAPTTLNVPLQNPQRNRHSPAGAARTGDLGAAGGRSSEDHQSTSEDSPPIRRPRRQKRVDDSLESSDSDNVTSAATGRQVQQPPGGADRVPEVDIRDIKTDNETRRKRPVSRKESERRFPVVCVADMAMHVSEARTSRGPNGRAPRCQDTRLCRSGVQGAVANRRDVGDVVLERRVEPSGLVASVGRVEAEAGVVLDGRGTTSARSSARLEQMGVDIVQTPEPSVQHCSAFTETGHNTCPKAPYDQLPQ